MTGKTYQVQVATILVIVATILLTWFGYSSTSEWQRSATAIANRRAGDALYLIFTALSRDMRGVQSQILPQLDPIDDESVLSELDDEIAKAFARFPYPDSFFSWTPGSHDSGRMYVFNRADRPPAWSNTEIQTRRFPTSVLKDPPVFAKIVPALRNQALLHTAVIVFETDIGGQTYQVVGRPSYAPASRTTLTGVVGFTVNLNWVRAHYFTEFTDVLNQVINGIGNSVALEIIDDSGTRIGGAAAGFTADPKAGVRERKFPVFFFDPVLRATAPAETLPLRYWTVRAEVLPDDETMTAATDGARRAFILISFATAGAVIALLFTARAARSAAALASMKSEFVSAVTHELKTPLSSIRLVSETLARGRFRDREKIGEYAGVLFNEVTRLTRTVDNLLTISRVQDVEGFYTFEAVDPGTLLEDALSSFQSQLKELGFDVKVDIPAPLPAVSVDRAAIILVLENILDNSIRYSNGTRHLTISASASDTQVRLWVADKGPGIPPAESRHVFEKFYRGRNVSSGGTGLGLAIVQRIMRDHRGEVRLKNAVGGGTVAEIILPIYKESPA
jgi:two-component system phosphate regulon sensor histidine kinase PhoR